jgi:exosortase
MVRDGRHAALGANGSMTRPGRQEQPSIGRNSEWLRPAVFISVLAAGFAWAYWPTIIDLVHSWDTLPDYSHGYLVVPLAVFFLWARRREFPGLPEREGLSHLVWLGPGLGLIVASLAFRVLGARYHLGSVDGWSMLLWMAGAVWVFGGWRVLWWSTPAVAFLWFMVPLPWRYERALSLPLQRIATKASTWVLQLLGQPAFAQGNVIYVGDHPFEVAQACSGLRIFVGVFGLAFAYCVLVRGSWAKRVVIILSTIPIALVANATRVVTTALLYEGISGEAARRFSHDFAGWMMIPFAAALFAAVVWYFDRLLVDVEEVDVADLVASRRPARAAVEPAPHEPAAASPSNG